MKKKYIIRGRALDAEPIRARVREYNNSVYGKVVRGQYVESNRERLRKYMREYMRRRRNKADKLGVCGNCMKAPRVKGTIFCNRCRDMVIRNSRKQRK
jgi:hypothetical protein